jgi:hypothetical protein
MKKGVLPSKLVLFCDCQSQALVRLLNDHKNALKQYEGVQDLSFYEMRWILKFSLKCRFLNNFNIFIILLKQP